MSASAIPLSKIAYAALSNRLVAGNRRAVVVYDVCLGSAITGFVLPGGLRHRTPQYPMI